MKQKFIIVSDLHGKNDWKSIKIENYYKILFLGDYCDSYTHTNEQILNNLLDIIQLNKDYADKIILLIGNHESHYLWFPEFRASGFRPEAQSELTRILNENRSLFQVAYEQEINNQRYLFTHAGISNRWYKKYKSIIDDYSIKFGVDKLADILNMISLSKDNYILHEVGYIRGGFSRYEAGGLTWADKSETSDDYLYGYHQCVGHTPQERINTVVPKFDRDGSIRESITYCDVLDKQPNTFYELEI